MSGLGKIIMTATEMQPFIMGIIVAVVVGLVLTAPISSAALCIMLGLSGIAGGAATVGCCAQMVGFAVISFKENGVGGLLAQGLGTSMLQVSNIIKSLDTCASDNCRCCTRTNFYLCIPDDKCSGRCRNGHIRSCRTDRYIYFNGIHF